MSDDWRPIRMREVCVVTAAVCGGIEVRGTVCQFMVVDMSGGWPMIAVQTTEALKEILPTLRPASIALECTDDERPSLSALVDEVRKDRRVAEARH